MDESLHHHLTGVGADAGRRESGGQQGDGERERRAAADVLREPGMGRFDRVDVGPAGAVEQVRRDQDHRQVDHAGQSQRDVDVEAGEAEQRAAFTVVGRLHPPLGQCRVQVDDVRHHGGPDDAGRQQHASGPVQVRNQALQRQLGRRSYPHQVVDEAREDKREQGDDGQFEASIAALLQRQHPEGDDRGDQAGRQQGHPEQQVQPDGGTDEFGQVGGHGDEFGLDPQPDGHPPGEVLAAQFGQVLAGDDAHLGGQVLDQHGNRVGHDDDPDQQIPVPRTGAEVGGEVAGVDVGDRRDEGRTE